MLYYAASAEDPGLEANLSTQAAASQAGAWFPAPHAQRHRQEGFAPTPTERPHSTHRRPRQVVSLRGSANYRRVLQQGARFSDRLLVLCALQRREAAIGEVARVGVVTSRRLGRAVQRNRLRRWVRESARAALTRPQGAWDLVFIARDAARTVSHDEVRESVARLVRRAGACEESR